MHPRPSAGVDTLKQDAWKDSLRQSWNELLSQSDHEVVHQAILRTKRIVSHHLSDPDWIDLLLREDDRLLRFMEVWEIQHSSNQYNNCTEITFLLASMLDRMPCKRESHKEGRGLQSGEKLARDIAREVLQRRMKLVYSYLSSGVGGRAKSALALLASIASLGSELSREQVSCFDWKFAGLQHLARPEPNQKKSKSSNRFHQSARQYFVAWVISLLNNADHGTCVRLLSLQQLIGPFFRYLAVDAQEVQIIALTFVKTALLAPDTRVPIGVRSGVFTGSFLSQLAIITAADVDSVSMQCPSEESSLAPSFLATFILIEIATKPSHGLLSKSVSEASLTRGGTKRILRLLHELQYGEFVNHMMILRHILQQVPVLSLGFIASFTRSLEPRLSQHWFCTISVLRDAFASSSIFPLPSCSGIIGHEAERGKEGSEFLQALYRRVLPNKNFKSPLTRGLQHKSMLICYGTLLLLESILVGCQHVKQSIIDMTNTQFASRESEFFSMLSSDFDEEIKRRLPDPQVVYKILQSAKQLDSFKPGHPRMMELIITRVVATLLLYEKSFPGSLRTSNIDPRKTFMLEMDQRKTPGCSGIYRSLLTELVGITIGTKGSRAVFDSKLFTLLLTSMVQNKGRSTFDSAQGLCVLLMKRTGIFTGQEQIPFLCIDSLLSLGNVEDIISSCHFISNIVGSVMKHQLISDNSNIHDNETHLCSHGGSVFVFCKIFASDYTKVMQSEKLHFKHKLAVTTFSVCFLVSLFQSFALRHKLVQQLVSDLLNVNVLQWIKGENEQKHLLQWLSILFQHSLALLGAETVSDDLKQSIRKIIAPLSGDSKAYKRNRPETEILETVSSELSLLIQAPSALMDILEDNCTSGIVDSRGQTFLYAFLKLHTIDIHSTKIADLFLHWASPCLTVKEAFKGRKRTFGDAFALKWPASLLRMRDTSVPLLISAITSLKLSEKAICLLIDSINFQMRDLQFKTALLIIASMGRWLQSTLYHPTMPLETKLLIVQVLFDVLEDALQITQEKDGNFLLIFLEDEFWGGEILHTACSWDIQLVIDKRLASVFKSFSCPAICNSSAARAIFRFAMTRVMKIIQNKSGRDKDLPSQRIEPLLDIILCGSPDVVISLWEKVRHNVASVLLSRFFPCFVEKLFFSYGMFESCITQLDSTFLQALVFSIQEKKCENFDNLSKKILEGTISKNYFLRNTFLDEHVGSIFKYCTSSPLRASKGKLLESILIASPDMEEKFLAYFANTLSDYSAAHSMEGFVQLVSCFLLPLRLLLGHRSNCKRFVLDVSFIESFQELLFRSDCFGIESMTLQLRDTDLFGIQSLCIHVLPHLNVEKRSQRVDELINSISFLVENTCPTGALQNQCFTSYGELLSQLVQYASPLQAVDSLSLICACLVKCLKFLPSCEVSLCDFEYLGSRGLGICKQVIMHMENFTIPRPSAQSVLQQITEYLQVSMKHLKLFGMLPTLAKELLKFCFAAKFSSQELSSLIQNAWILLTESPEFLEVVTERNQLVRANQIGHYDGPVEIPLALAASLLDMHQGWSSTGKEPSQDLRSTCLEMLHLILSCSPEEGHMHHFQKSETLFTALLASYGGTMSAVDRTLFRILNILNNLWGKQCFAFDRFCFWDVRPALSKLESQGSVMELINSLDPQRVALTVLLFPIQYSAYCSPSEELSTGHHSFSSKYLSFDCKRQERYDPHFILLIMEYLIQKGAGAMELTQSGFLAIALAAMSAESVELRRHAYGCLSLVMEILEDAMFKEKTQLSLLLIHVRSSVSEPFQKMPSLYTLFWANCSMIVLHPEHWMYPDINRYFLKSPVEDFQRIPMFFRFIHSGRSSHRQERQVMLYLLYFGIRATEDGICLRKQFGMELLMSMASSSLVDAFTRFLILQTICQAALIRGVCFDLTEHSALVPWLTQLFVEEISKWVSLSADEAALSENILKCIVGGLTSISQLLSFWEGQAHHTQNVQVQLVEAVDRILAVLESFGELKVRLPKDLVADIVEYVHGTFQICSNDPKLERHLVSLIRPKLIKEVLDLAQFEKKIAMIVLLPIQAWKCSQDLPTLLKAAFDTIKAHVCAEHAELVLSWLAKAAYVCEGTTLASELAKTSMYVRSFLHQDLFNGPALIHAIVTLLPAMKTSQKCCHLAAIAALDGIECSPTSETSGTKDRKKLCLALREVERVIEW